MQRVFNKLIFVGFNLSNYAKGDVSSKTGIKI